MVQSDSISVAPQYIFSKSMLMLISSDVFTLKIGKIANSNM